MLAITVRLLHGTIRAGTPDDTVLAGGESPGEWPPSPARLFCALVAGDGTGTRCVGTTGEELRWLETLGPPLIAASDRDEVLAGALVSRYVVINATDSGSVQEYPGRKAKRVSPGTRLAPKVPVIRYLWSDAQPEPSQLAALRYRAARVGYLGCADSPVEVSVSDSVSGVDSLPTWRPDPRGLEAFPVPFPGFLSALDESYLSWSEGEPMRRAWIRTKRARYCSPNPRLNVAPPSRRVIWLRFDRSIPGRNLLLVTTTLRDAVLDHVQRLVGSAELSPVLHGHRDAGEHGPQVDFVGLVDVGHPNASGKIFGAALSMPRDIDPELAETLHSATLALTGERLVAPKHFNLGLGIYAAERKPWTLVPRRWTAPARTWVSATPVVYERWTKGPLERSEVERWCRNADLEGALEEIAASRAPMVEGALDLPPSLVFRTGREHRPYSHLRLRFAEPVKGPVVLGRGRQLGLGLFVPGPRDLSLDDVGPDDPASIDG